VTCIKNSQDIAWNTNIKVNIALSHTYIHVYKTLWMINAAGIFQVGFVIVGNIYLFCEQSKVGNRQADVQKRVTWTPVCDDRVIKKIQLVRYHDRCTALVRSYDLEVVVGNNQLVKHEMFRDSMVIFSISFFIRFSCNFVKY